MAAEWYRRKAQYDETCRPHCPTEDLSTLDDQIQYSEEQQEKVKALWAGTPTITARESPNDTKVINWVADFLSRMTTPRQPASGATGQSSPVTHTLWGGNSSPDAPHHSCASPVGSG